MSKRDLSLRAIKDAVNASMPDVPPGSDRVSLIASGNPDVLAEAAGRESDAGYKPGPAWLEGLRNCTPIQHRNNKQDGNDIGRDQPVTY